MGGAPKNTTSTTTQEPSKFIKPYLSDLYSGAQATSRKKYNPFKGDRIEGFSDDELSAHEGIRDFMMLVPEKSLAGA